MTLSAAQKVPLRVWFVAEVQSWPNSSASSGRGALAG
jgi:hypothetical protein